MNILDCDAPRGKEFVEYIRGLLKIGKLKESYIRFITNEEGMKIYDQAFTHESCNSELNYEYYETLGDVTVNKSIVWYCHRRFPILMETPKSESVLSRLKITLGSKESLYRMAERMGLWPFVRATTIDRQQKKRKILEDVFEAFIGATEYLIDSRIRRCAGYDICYNIIKSQLDQINIQLTYEFLFDAKSRLKELAEGNKLKFSYRENIKRLPDKNLHVIEYEIFIDPRRVIQTLISRPIQGIPPNVKDILIEKNKNLIQTNQQKSILGIGEAFVKVDAEQQASQMAISILNAVGFRRELNPSQQKIFGKQYV